MTWNFVEIGGTYESEKAGTTWKCIGINDGVAWCYMLPDAPAHRFMLDGSGVDLKKTKLLPPGPRIAKHDANLHDNVHGEWTVSNCHDLRDTNGTLYTHEDAEVAIFVPEGINSAALNDAIAEILLE